VTWTCTVLPKNTGVVRLRYRYPTSKVVSVFTVSGVCLFVALALIVQQRMAARNHSSARDEEEEQQSPLKGDAAASWFGSESGRSNYTGNGNDSFTTDLTPHDNRISVPWSSPDHMPVRPPAALGDRAGVANEVANDRRFPYSQ
jgi:hypothetical protein